MSISGTYVTLLMNIICLDGLAQQLLPAYNVLDGAEMPLRLYGFLSILPPNVAARVMRALFPLAIRWKKFTDWRFLKKFRGKLLKDSNQAQLDRGDAK